MNTSNADLLRDAVARNCGMVLSLPSAGLVRHYKSRFLAEADDGLCVESISSESPLINELIANATPVGVSFRSDTTKVVFAVPIRRSEPSYRINSEIIVKALVLARPDNVTSVQRRNAYRVRVGTSSELTGRVWRIAERASLRERPMPGQEVTTELLDISLGGLGVCFRGKESTPPKVTPDDRLRIELTFRDISLVVEGRCRAVRRLESAEAYRSGIEFKRLEGEIEGRQNLARLTNIVGQLQRDEIRRARLGMG